MRLRSIKLALFIVLSTLASVSCGGPTATPALPSTQITSVSQPESARTPVAARPTDSTAVLQSNDAHVAMPAPSLTPTKIATRTPSPTPAPTPKPTQPPTPQPAPTPKYPGCGDAPIFTVSPVGIESIDHIAALGNLNPPGHTLPTDRMYVYLTNADRDDVTDISTLYSPGNLRVTILNATQHVNAGFTDFGMTLVPCEDIWLSFGHITALSSDLFGETDSYKDWHLTKEYGLGGEIYRNFRKDVDVIVTAGEILGTTGGNPGIIAFDFGMVDLRVNRDKSVANPERYQHSYSLSRVCFLLYYEEGPVLNQIVDLVKRDKVEGEGIPCGSYLQDVSGTAQGNWFLSGTSGKNPEHPHLALVHSNLRPAQAVISMGNSVEGLKSGKHEFLPVDDGLLNRDFKDISSNSLTYGYEILRPGRLDFVGVIIVQMPDPETLWVEALTGATTNPTSWVFTENKTIFKR